MSSSRSGVLVQTLRVIVVLLIVAVAMLAYALWGRAGRERRAVLPSRAPVIAISQLTEVKPVKEIELDYHAPDLPPGPGKMNLLRNVLSATRRDMW